MSLTGYVSSIVIHSRYIWKSKTALLFEISDDSYELPVTAASLSSCYVWSVTLFVDKEFYNRFLKNITTIRFCGMRHPELNKLKGQGVSRYGSKLAQS